MDTKYLSYILIIAKKENMIEAIEELFISRSTLSQHLSKLESELGTPLFYRNKDRLTLTTADRLYIDVTEKVMSTKDNPYQDVQNLDNRGHTIIGITSQFAFKMLAELILPLKSRSPDVTIEISEVNAPSLTQSILEEDIDCSTMALDTVESFSRDQARVLRREEIFSVTPGTYSHRRINPGRPVIIPGFARYFSEDNILVSKRGSTPRCLTDRIVEVAGWIPSTVCETNSVIATRNMVAMGIGVIFIGASCAINREHVSYCPLEPRLYCLNTFVIRKNWVTNRPESTLCHDILHYFSNQG